MKQENINKYLASLGVASRRKAASLVEDGRVMVNQKKASVGQLVSDQDEILVDNQRVGRNIKLIYLMLNKPKGVVSTVADEHERLTVVDLVNLPIRVYPVGRLDQNTQGLILLTNDGDLANLLTHPKFEVPKTYQALILGNIEPDQLNKLRVGVYLKDGRTAPAQVEILTEESHTTLLQITLYEGKNRQVRRMLGSLGLNLLNLKRVAIGSLSLDSLAEGKFRRLTATEVANLRNYSLQQSIAF
ncbi:rRNA pseudouridine synthase [Patescibacteria group bacterium]|nr:rRNA pseudouridine synthase [Patescibacteria group bacterium]MCL5410142.1 rRNA pseudouridine synthase [Patescibacteria group bacterium]